MVFNHCTCTVKIYTELCTYTFDNFYTIRSEVIRLHIVLDSFNPEMLK